MNQGDQLIQDNGTIPPVQHTPCCIAVALRPRLIEAIDDLAAQGVIALVTTPTKWISSIVAAS